MQLVLRAIAMQTKSYKPEVILYFIKQHLNYRLIAFQILPLRDDDGEIFVALFDAPMAATVILDQNQSNPIAPAKTSSAQRSTTQCVAPTTSPIPMNALCTTTRALKGKQLRSPTRVSAVSKFHLDFKCPNHSTAGRTDKRIKGAAEMKGVWTQLRVLRHHHNGNIKENQEQRKRVKSTNMA